MKMAVDPALIGQEYDHTVFAPVTEAEIREYIEASREVPAEDGEADDLIAPPTFVVRLRGRRFMPGGMPERGRTGFDAGKDIEFGVPVRPGDVLTASSTVHDLYEKTGRSGSMAFVVLRTVITNQRDQLVATIDQKMMFR
jgi:acyl dehydratase